MALSCGRSLLFDTNGGVSACLEVPAVRRQFPFILTTLALLASIALVTTVQRSAVFSRLGAVAWRQPFQAACAEHAADGEVLPEAQP
jgi:hypothetical protein